MAIALLASAIFRDAATTLIRQGLSMNAVARTLRADGFTFGNTVYRDAYRSLKAGISFSGVIEQLDPRKLLPQSVFRPTTEQTAGRFLYVTEVSFTDPLTGVQRTRRQALHSDERLSPENVRNRTAAYLADLWKERYPGKDAPSLPEVTRVVDVYQYSTALAKARERNNK